MNTTLITRTTTLTGLPVVVKVEQKADCAPLILTVRDEASNLLIGIYTDDVAAFHLTDLFNDADTVQIMQRLAIATH